MIHSHQTLGPRVTFVLGVLLWAAATLAGPRAARAACSTNICTPVGANPCTIGAGTYNLDDGCVLDFGARSVTVAGNATVQPTESDFGEFTIAAASLTIRGLLRAPGGVIYLNAANAFRTETSSGAAGSP